MFGSIYRHCCFCTWPGARLGGSGAFTDLALGSLGNGLAGTEFTLDGLGDVLGKVLKMGMFSERYETVEV
jgi:hypothetical protein